jgi:pimeloyl-ACP methyl ester carboxylesterase
MRSLFEPLDPSTPAATRMLLLPGAYNEPENFLQAGFVSAVRARHLPLDLVLVDITLPQLTDRTLLRQLHDELVQPARASGARSVWIAGVSLGGYMALLYADRYPGDVDGLCLLAPYLGNRIVTGEIERARGLAGWSAGEIAADDEERRLWKFIQGPRDDRLALHLGFGSEDRFAPAQRLMAQALPRDAVDVVPGGHDWPVWRALWERFLDQHWAHAAPGGEAARRPT